MNVFTSEQCKEVFRRELFEHVDEFCFTCTEKIKGDKGYRFGGRSVVKVKHGFVGRLEKGVTGVKCAGFFSFDLEEDRCVRPSPCT